jgi:hypothetical protein
MSRFISFILCFSFTTCISQNQFPHVNAHAHNDYEHTHPLKDALQNGFISVEADVHLQDGKLLVSHNRPEKNSPTLEKLYLSPLDSMLKVNSGTVYGKSGTTFYLMIDIKTDAEATYQSIKKTLSQYPALSCSKNCPVKIFISGNRSITTIVKEGYSGIAIDGRPDDVGKGYSSELMPVISDQFKNWSDWNGKSELTAKDLARVEELANRIHAEGKKLRLWAIPDNEKAWDALFNAGIDFINTDHLPELNTFLHQRGF